MNTLTSKQYNYRIICYYSGYIVIGTALLMLIPVIVALLFREFEPMLDFIIAFTSSLFSGLLLVNIGIKALPNKKSLQWKHGFIIVALSWLIITLLSAIPYRLSGHSMSYLDACFDVMSGLTTTGVVLLQDIDHISLSLNTWRHILTFIGGQGVVVLALTFLVHQIGGGYKIYVGEAKDIELAPNVRNTARIIWKISLYYLLIGTIILWIIGIFIGLNPLSSFFHAIFMFVSSWSTGGFSPMSQNIMYYHSFIYETATLLLFILGSLNFGIHYAVIKNNKKEIYKNIEIQSFFITSVLACSLIAISLFRSGVYTDSLTIFRRVVFNILSAHTTTGLGSVYAQDFARDWGSFALLIMIISMLIGGSACSTAGGFKGLRVGILVKGLISDIKKALSSERNIHSFKYHYFKDQVLDDKVVKSSALIIICYITTFTIGTLLSTFYGYPFLESAFESASVTGNVGLSIGIISPSIPSLLKYYYIFTMFIGRLEFLSVFVLIGYIIGGVTKLWKKR